VAEIDVTITKKTKITQTSIVEDQPFQHHNPFVPVFVKGNCSFRPACPTRTEYKLVFTNKIACIAQTFLSESKVSLTQVETTKLTMKPAERLNFGVELEMAIAGLHANIPTPLQTTRDLYVAS
jgi:hypothetical protein